MNSLIETASTLYKAGKLREAEMNCRKGLAQEPTNPTGYFVLGLCSLASNRPRSAAESFRQAIALKPQIANYYYHLAIATERSNLPTEARSAYNRAIELQPDEPIYHAGLGDLLKHENNIDEAIQCFQRALTLRESPFGYCAIAELYKRQQRHGEAENCLHLALTLAPDLALAHELLGMVYEETGRFPEAIDAFKNAYRLQPDKTAILYRISRCHRVDTRDLPFIETLLGLAGNAHLKREQTRYVEYALGKSYDDLGDYELAIQHFDKANELSKQIQFGGKPHALTAYQESFEAVKNCFTNRFFNEMGPQNGVKSERPVFIVGMIRSGTTLLEQVLSCHPQVAGAGELAYWLEPAAKSVLQNVLSGQLDPVDLARLSQKYLELLQKNAGHQVRVTDKMPNNYMALGLVHLLFPNAKIIHARRNPVDTCLSIYTTVYTEPPRFAYDRKNIVAAYRMYQDLMAHWERVIPPDRLMTVDYEDLISDREAITRKLVNFCGLEWDAVCLRPEDNQRLVTTPSLWQVRQPIYRSSVDRWKNYEPWLREFNELRKDNR